MIMSFYDRDFVPIKNNASFVIDNASYRLTKKPIDLNEFSCVCEPFTEDVQPTFCVVKDNRGRYIYGALAGVIEINDKNQSVINGTDLKTLLDIDLLIDISGQNFTTVNQYFRFLFDNMDFKIIGMIDNMGRILKFDDNMGNVNLTYLYPGSDTEDKQFVVNVLTELQTYAKYYDLYIDPVIEITTGATIFNIGRTMSEPKNIKLWEKGIHNYGKHILGTIQYLAFYNDNGNYDMSNVWTLLDDNTITSNQNITSVERSPLKRRIVVSTKSTEDADKEAISALLDEKYKEDIELPVDIISNESHSFKDKYIIWRNKGDNKPYTELPCGALYYNSNGLYKYKIGYRYTDINYI